MVETKELEVTAGDTIMDDGCVRNYVRKAKSKQYD